MNCCWISACDQHKKNKGADRKCKIDRTFFSSYLNKNYINELLNNCTFRNEEANYHFRRTRELFAQKL